VRAGADEARAQLLREACRTDPVLPRARLADRGLPVAGAPVPAGALRGGRRGGRGRARVDADRCRRLRNRHVRAATRADGARVLATPRARGRCPRRRRHARAPRSHPRTARGGLRPHEDAAGLGREGRRRGPALRRRTGRARRRAQGRGRGDARRAHGAGGLPRDSGDRLGRARRRARPQLTGRGRRRAPDR
jgi:hypothetical protein